MLTRRVICDGIFSEKYIVVYLKYGIFISLGGGSLSANSFQWSNGTIVIKVQHFILNILKCFQIKKCKKKNRRLYTYLSLLSPLVFKVEISRK